VTAPNVVALLPGSDPSLRGEYIVLGAHLDHIGDWPQLNSGADDNASGSAALLEVARAAGAAGRAPRRTLVFVWFAGEEIGLLGADHFAGHPAAGLTTCKAVLNMDMVGAGDGAWVSGGENFPEIFDALKISRDRFAPGLKLKAGLIRGEARADHGPFFDRGVHAVSLFGMGGSHHGYHTADDTSWWITPKTIEGVARTVFGAAWDLADRN
jgi:Zn-dependent M28 family amino/carboxypeptidase